MAEDVKKEVAEEVSKEIKQEEEERKTSSGKKELGKNYSLLLWLFILFVGIFTLSLGGIAGGIALLVIIGGLSITLAIANYNIEDYGRTSIFLFALGLVMMFSSQFYSIDRLIALIMIFAVIGRTLLWMWTAGEENTLWRILVFLIIGTTIFLLFYLSPLCSGLGGIVGPTCSTLDRGRMTVASLFTRERWEEVIEKGQASLEKTQAKLIGDYYTGKVDENAEIDLGVFLGEIKQTDPKIFDTDPAVFYTTLTAQTLDEPINISVSCRETIENEGSVQPAEPFTVDVSEQRDIDCVFDAGQLETGLHDIKISADFNFKTMSYLKTYFMDQERMRSLRRQNIDPLDQYGISDKMPSTIYTSGPIMIGMGIGGSPPIGINQDLQRKQLTLGITIENQWEGKVKNLNEFNLIIPAGIVLKQLVGCEGGACQFTKINCKMLDEPEQGCDDTLYNIYSVNVANERNIEYYKSYRAYLEMDKADYEKVLGVTPVSARYFKITLEYDYSLERAKNIQILKSTATIAGGADITAPKIENIDINAGTRTATITWETDEETNDIFEYWIHPNTLRKWYGDIEIGYSETHSVELDNLGPNTEYGYEIRSRDQHGNEGLSGKQTFKTEEAEES